MENCATFRDPGDRASDVPEKRAREASAGSKFAMLTLLSADPSGTRKHPRWLMRCDCGVEKVIDLWAVRSGRQVSCGCFWRKRISQDRIKDMAGQRFGRLLVRRFYIRSGKDSLWLCECDCGCGYIARGAQLTCGRVKTCGCARRPFEERQKTAEDLQKYARNHTRRARSKGAEGKFTRKDIERIYALQRGRCAWCPASLKAGYHRDHRNPLAKGGSNHPGNIELLCPRCNTRKQDKEPSEWAKLNGKLL